MAEQIGAVLAEAGTAVGPDGADAPDILGDIGGHFGQRLVAPHVHRHVAAQGHETAVHLRTDRAGQRAGGLAEGPEVRFRETLGKVFGDGQGIPDGAVLAQQHRHLGSGRIGQQTLVAVGLVEGDQHLFIGSAGQLHRQPATQ
ncbi:hypothetical protein D9M71_681370 [compost metagenome]